MSLTFQTNGLDNLGNILTIGEHATSILLGNNLLQTITNYASETFIVSPTVPTPSTSNTTVASTAYVTTALSNFLNVANTWTTQQTFNAGPIVQTQAAASNTTIAASTQYVTTALSNFLTAAHTWTDQQIFSTTNKPQIGANYVISTTNSSSVLFWSGVVATSIQGTVTVSLNGFAVLLGVVATVNSTNGTARVTVSALSNTAGGQFVLTTSGVLLTCNYTAFGTAL